MEFMLAVFVVSKFQITKNMQISLAHRILNEHFINFVLKLKTIKVLKT